MGMDERCLPRILVVFDEFQVPFTDPEKRVVDLIKDYMRRLIKRGRYCGCHLLFCSSVCGRQPAEGYLDAFPIRMALRCSEGVSIEHDWISTQPALMPSTATSIPTQRLALPRKSTCLWHTPFTNPKGIYGDGRSLLNIMHELVVEHREVDRRASFTGRIV